jgi:hypothetical protein
LQERAVSVSTKTWLVLLALVLFLTVLLTLLFRTIARDLIVGPLLYALWVGGLALGVVPQILFWVLLLLIGLLVAVHSLTERKRQLQSTEEVKAAYRGRVRTLLRWVQHASQSAYFKGRLARRLTTLAIETEAYRKKHVPGQPRPEYLGSQLEGLDVPPEVRAYLQAGMMPMSASTLTPVSRFVRRLRFREPAPFLDPDLEAVVQFLEDQLEVSSQ